MFRFFMHRHITTFEVFVCSGNISMSGLITCNYNSFSIGQITYSGIFQGIELVTIRKLEFCTDFVEVVSVDFGCDLFF